MPPSFSTDCQQLWIILLELDGTALTPSLHRLKRALLVVMCTLAPVLTTPTEAQSRFFFSGDGTIDLQHVAANQRITLTYRDRNDHYDPAALARIQHFFRSRTDGQGIEVSLRLIELIDFAQDRFRPGQLVLVSAFRSPEYNEQLRRGGGSVAKASLHTEGLAADLQFVGLDLRDLWQKLRALEVGGVGLYEEDGFLHIDTGAPRFWEPETSGVKSNLSADNGRILGRTDFDRYEDLQGAQIRLHRVTAFPLRIAQRARAGKLNLEIEPVGGRVAIHDGCYVIAEEGPPYTFVVTTAAGLVDRQPIELTTCLPRAGRTPETIRTNAVEPLHAAASLAAG